MNFYIIRYLILIISLLALIYITKKRIVKLTKKRLILIIVIGNILCWMPYEKLFLSFYTPEKAFSYSFPNYEICKTLENNDYTFFLYKKVNTYSLTYFSKNSRDKWLFKNPLFLNDVELNSRVGIKIIERLNSYKRMYLYRLVAQNKIVFGNFANLISTAGIYLKNYAKSVDELLAYNKENVSFDELGVPKERKSLTENLEYARQLYETEQKRII